MRDIQDLKDAILHDGDNLDVWAIAADWLEEHDREDAATLAREFIERSKKVRGISAEMVSHETHMGRAATFNNPYAVSNVADVLQARAFAAMLILQNIPVPIHRVVQGSAVWHGRRWDDFQSPENDTLARLSFLNDCGLAQESEMVAAINAVEKTRGGPVDLWTPSQRFATEVIFAARHVSLLTYRHASFPLYSSCPYQNDDSHAWVEERVTRLQVWLRLAYRCFI